MLKIGLVAPFEGRYRAIGYEAIYAARLAIREINAAGGIGGVRVELFALDDGGDPQQAIEQARKLALDPQVIAVVGHYRSGATNAAIDVYCEERLPILAVESGRTGACPGLYSLTAINRLSETPVEPDAFLFTSTVLPLSELPEAKTFVERYNAIPIDGTRAGPIALQTYDAMYLLFEAIGKADRAPGEVSRDSLSASLTGDFDFDGLAGVYRFSETGDRLGAITRVYRYDKDGSVEWLQPQAP